MLAILTSHPIQYQVPLWRALAADGRVRFEVWYLTPHAVRPCIDREFGETFAWDEDLLAGYPHRFVPIAPNWSIDRFRGVQVTEPWTHQLRTRGITTLWVEGWRFLAFWSAVHAARQLGVAVWMRGETPDFLPERWHARWWKRPLLRRLFSSVDAFLVIGSANRRFYQRIGISDTRLHTAPYAVDNDAWRTAAERLQSERAAIREAWGIAPSARCVLFAGKLVQKKRPVDLVRAARSLDGLHLLFAGEGELRGALEQALQSAGAPRATLAGFLNLSQIARAFVAADALVLPSDHGETWGLVVNEAMAAGVPCVVSDRCGCAEDLVRSTDPALVFRATDIADLRRALERVLAMPPSRATLWSRVQQHSLLATVETAVNLTRHSTLRPA
jgi:glycosyltransferase involved in cell wall biosynthesis